MLLFQLQLMGGGDIASKQLEKANLLTSGIGLPLPVVPGTFNPMRLRTLEIKPWRMCPENMETIAGFSAFCLSKMKILQI